MGLIVGISVRNLLVALHYIQGGAAPRGSPRLNEKRCQYPPVSIFITTSINIHPSPQHIPLYIKHLRDVLNAFGEKSIVYTHALATPSLQAIAMYAIRASIETIATPSVLAPSIHLIKMFDAQASECVYDDVHRFIVL